MSTLGSMALAALVGCFGLPACTNHDDPSPAYAPGLGELMTFTQIRHAKLWMAGVAGNWELAAYETDELEEGFHDVLTFHPTHQDAPLPLKEVLPAMTNAPLVALRTAIGRRDKAAFEAAFDSLTAGCNNCHQALKHGFNVVRRPIADGFPNQDFTPPAVMR
jgi:cytochrome c553